MARSVTETIIEIYKIYKLHISGVCFTRHQSFHLHGNGRWNTYDLEMLG